MASSRAGVLRALFQGRSRHITDAAWFSPPVRELVRDAPPKVQRALLSVYESSRFTFDETAQHDLTARLQAFGYSVPPGRQVPDGRQSRLETLQELHDRHAGSTNAELLRLRKIVGHATPVLAAVIDVGFDEHHPLLEGKLWSGTDGSGATVHGRNFGDGTSNLWGKNFADAGHGTHVAGIAGRGSETVELMLLKVSNGGSSTFDVHQVAAAIDFAAEQGVRVLNISLKCEGPGGPGVIMDAIRRHPQMLVIKSAGNEGEELGVSPKLTPDKRPEAHSSPNLLVIASALADGTKDPQSNYGSAYATHAARGNSIVSLAVADGFKSLSGTSMAAPEIENTVAAGILMLDPALTPRQVSQLLTDATTPSSAWDGLVASGGVAKSRTAYRLAAASALLRQGKSPEEAAKALRLPNGAVARHLVSVARGYGHSPIKSCDGGSLAPPPTR